MDHLLINLCNNTFHRHLIQDRKQVACGLFELRRKCKRKKGELYSV